MDVGQLGTVTVMPPTHEDCDLVEQLGHGELCAFGPEGMDKAGQMLVLSVKRMSWIEMYSRYDQNCLECGVWMRIYLFICRGIPSEQISM